MKTPYCTMNGVEFQLYWIKGVLRFLDDGRPMPDLNQMVVDYMNGKTSLKPYFQYCVNSGCSYELVYGIFSKNGINNHTVLQGNEPTLKFRLYLGKSYERHKAECLIAF